MTSRNEMKGIAAGVVGKFTSRNNDIDGYWAMGILYQTAIRNKTSELSLNLKTGESVPKYKHSKQLAAPFLEYIYCQMNKRNWDIFRLKQAMVELHFRIQLDPTKDFLYKNSWGEPYKCIVLLTDDRDKNYTFETKGWCAQHNPSKERRSTRADIQ